ncbi:type II toxin-antitoxin system RelE/ParE family toxin [Neisseria sp. 83E34]|uniref:type II toxin-antitoxin system RelE family toxin n=1 Tax=Neisseria sp. 83E34 TaxID=1692264 RepID=UPI0006CE8C87|nr:type II toxin-antitoxin system RelE/ParE family toxin [Neisseria sp. 83E34]KPN72407.1 hypothetical protein AKG09_00705 [Neisseria sp. 83E34]
MPKVFWTPKATKQLLKIDPKNRAAISNKAKSLSAFPDVEADIKKMAGMADTYRLRVGNYRLIFQWQKNQEPHIIEIQQVETRQSVYKN